MLSVSQRLFFGAKKSWVRDLVAVGQFKEGKRVCWLYKLAIQGQRLALVLIGLNALDEQMVIEIRHSLR